MAKAKKSTRRAAIRAGLFSIAYVALLSFTSCSGTTFSNASSPTVFSGAVTCVPTNTTDVEGVQATYDCSWPGPAIAPSKWLFQVNLSDNADDLYTKVVGTTANATYSITVNTDKVYYFGVSLVYKGKTTPNFNYFLLNAGAGSGAAPKFSGLADAVGSSKNQISLRWNPCVSVGNQTCIYTVYRAAGSSLSKLTNLGSTTNLAMSVDYTNSDLNQVNNSSYLVRARTNGSMNDQNTILLASPFRTDFGIPFFTGLKRVNVASGINGLQEVDLFWNIDDVNVIGYQIFRSNNRGLPLVGDPAHPTSNWTYTQQDANTLSPATSLVGTTIPIGNSVPTKNSTFGYLVKPSINSIRVTNLSPDTDWYFAVRAVNAAGTIVEENRVDDPHAHTKAKLVTTGFTGIATIGGPGGLSDFTEVDITWPTPDTNAPGVWDGFVVEYEPGTCAQGFSATPYTQSIPDPLATAVGLTNNIIQNTTYRVRVQATYSAVAGQITHLTKCQERTTTATAPTFLGVNSVIPDPAPLGLPTNGFTQFLVSYPIATGSFTQYHIIATPLVTPNRPVLAAPHDQACETYAVQNFIVSSISLTQKQIGGLEPGCNYRVQVLAEFVCNPPASLGGAGCTPQVILAKGDIGAASGLVANTTPISPGGEGAIVVHANDTNANVDFRLPTMVNQLYNQIAVYHAEGPGAKGVAETAARSHNVPYATFSTVPPPNPLNWADPNTLTANVTHCYAFVAQYVDGFGSPTSFPIWSTATPVAVCGDTVKNPPTPFSGILSFSRPDSLTGFTTALATWTNFDAAKPADLAAIANWSFYEIAWDLNAANLDLTGPNPVTCMNYAVPTSINCPFFSQTTRVTSVASSFRMVSGLPENRVVYGVVRAVNAHGSGTAIAAGGTSPPGVFPYMANTTTFPKAPVGGFKKLAVGGVDSIRLTQTIPPSNSTIGGLFDSVLVAVYPNTSNTNVVNSFYSGRKVSVDGRNVFSILMPPLFTNPATTIDYTITATGQASTSIVYNFPTQPLVAPVILRFMKDNFVQSSTLPTDVVINLKGLTANVNACALSHNVYMADTFPNAGPPIYPFSRFMEESPLPSISVDCKAPSATSPAFPYATDDGSYFDTSDGVLVDNNTGLLPKNLDVRDFTELDVVLPPVSGACDAIQVRVWDSAHKPVQGGSETNAQYLQRIFGAGGGWTASFDDNNCSALSHKFYTSVDNLVTYSNYYVAARALLIAAGQELSSGGMKLSNQTSGNQLMPPAPDDTGVATVGVNDSRLSACTGGNYQNCYDAINIPARLNSQKYTSRITWAPVNNGVEVNNVYIWKSENISKTAATAALLTSAQTKGDFSGPTNAPTFTASVVASSFIDTQVNATNWSCYLVKTVYSQGALYNAGFNTNVSCVAPTYQAPTFPGIASVTANGTCADGSSKIQITLASSASTFDVDQYRVYFSPTMPVGWAAAPGNTLYSNIVSAFSTAQGAWLTFNAGDSTFDPVATDNLILMGCQGNTIAGTGYYYVQTYFAPATTLDQNTKVASFTLPPSQGNYVFIPKAATKLSYDFYMMTMEASVNNPANLSTADVIVNDANLIPCNANFHNFSNGTGYQPAANGCGTIVSTAYATSRPSVTPQKASWSQAWTACRNASTNSFRVRLPTDQEWRRANKWASDQYSSMFSGGNFFSNSCNFTASARLTGANSTCKNYLGILDGAGNMREWVDARLKRQDMTNWARSFGQIENLLQLGRMVDNGIDRQTPLFHLLDPGTSGMALLMGSGVASSAYTQQKDAGTESWFDLDPLATLPVDAGFRCIAVTKQNSPTMGQLELARESRYANDFVNAANGDLPPAVHDWTVPRTKYLRAQFDNFGDYRYERISFVSGPSQSGGGIKISWAPWEKSCGVGCTSLFKYHVYRFQDPSLKDERFNPSWGLAPSTEFPSPKPLDPLAVNSSMVDTWGAANQITPLAGVSPGTNCLGALPYSCSVTDTQSPTDAKKAWIYVIVAEDESHNFMTPWVQRFRTPHLAGIPAKQSASGIQFASFRSEARLRRISHALLDPTFSGSQTIKQYLAWVPMHESGNDHDFYVSKYETSVYFGAVDSNDIYAPSSNSGGTTAWSSNAAVCYETVMRTGIAPAACGTSSLNLVLKSEPLTVAINNANYGSLTRGCISTVVQDGAGTPNVYPMLPVSGTEWGDAADWGDINFDGVVDNHPILTNFIETLSLRTYEDDTSHCAVSLAQASVLTGSLSGCVSRYGVMDAIGLNADIVAEQVFNAEGLDNGLDGRMLGRSAPGENGFKRLQNTGFLSDKWDFLRFTPALNGVGAAPGYSYNYNGLTDPGNAAVFHGGAADTRYGSTGYLSTRYYPSDYVHDSVNGRCRF